MLDSVEPLCREEGVASVPAAGCRLNWCVGPCCVCGSSHVRPRFCLLRGGVRCVVTMAAALTVSSPLALIAPRCC
jgi:hypothetical protein